MTLLDEDLALLACETPVELRQAICDNPKGFLGDQSTFIWWHNYIMVAAGFFGRRYLPGISQTLCIHLGPSGTLELRDRRPLRCRPEAYEALIYIAVQDLMADSAAPRYGETHDNGLIGDYSYLFGMAAVCALSSSFEITVETARNLTALQYVEGIPSESNNSEACYVLTSVVARPRPDLFGETEIDSSRLRQAVQAVFPSTTLNVDLPRQFSGSPRAVGGPPKPDPQIECSPSRDRVQDWLRCSFCGSSGLEKTLVDGGTACICADCASLAAERLAEPARHRVPRPPRCASSAQWLQFHEQRLDLEDLSEIGDEIWLFRSRDLEDLKEILTSEELAECSRTVATPLGPCFALEDEASNRAVVLQASEDRNLGLQAQKVVSS